MSVKAQRITIHLNSMKLEEKVYVYSESYLFRVNFKIVAVLNGFFFFTPRLIFIGKIVFLSIF